MFVGDSPARYRNQPAEQVFGGLIERSSGSLGGTHIGHRGSIADAIQQAGVAP